MTEQRWFHKEDGGLMIGQTCYTPAWLVHTAWYSCSICGYTVSSRDEHFNVELLRDWDCIPYSELSDKLQAMALSEML